MTVPNVKAGKLKALAVTTARRWPDLPDVPTMIESGYAGFDVPFWLGVLVPAQTPPAIVQTLYNFWRNKRTGGTVARSEDKVSRSMRISKAGRIPRREPVPGPSFRHRPSSM